jgi:hypothetical protein
MPLRVVHAMRRPERGWATARTAVLSAATRWSTFIWRRVRELGTL